MSPNYMGVMRCDLRDVTLTLGGWQCRRTQTMSGAWFGP